MNFPCVSVVFAVYVWNGMWGFLFYFKSLFPSEKEMCQHYPCALHSSWPFHKGMRQEEGRWVAL